MKKFLWKGFFKDKEFYEESHFKTEIIMMGPVLDANSLNTSLKWYLENYYLSSYDMFFTIFIYFCFSYSSLKSLIEKPPIGGKELLPLTGSQLSGFRLHPGPVSMVYFFITSSAIILLLQSSQLWLHQCCEMWMCYWIIKANKKSLNNDTLWKVFCNAS